MKLLLIANNQSDVDFLATTLDQHRASDVEMRHAGNLAAAARLLGTQSFDIVLLDLKLPDGEGMACIDAIQAVAGHTPLVVLSEQDDERLAISILNRGVQDYLVKWEGDGHTIFRTFRYAIERKRSQLRLSYLARYDALTETPNRQYFTDQLERALARARREGRKLALFVLDLDQFHAINDQFGRDAGDHLLFEMASRLRRAIRKGDVLARLGGNQFAILAEGIAGAREAETIVSKMLDEIDQPCAIGSGSDVRTASVGITIYPNDNGNSARLLKNAGAALLHAKQRSGNSWQFFTARMQADLAAYQQLERGIGQAIDDESFRVAYQPKVHLVDRRLQGLEALLRWDCPQRGPVAPADFIPVAEDSGHIVPLGYWVLSEVCRSIKGWERQALPLVPVSVNISARQFQQADFHHRVAELLDTQGVDPQLIELELSERLIMQDIDATQRSLRFLKDVGVRISIDDFGTGYSCLKHLQRFPIDTLKIDRSFIHEIGVSGESGIIIDAIMALARSLTLDTVGEGIETTEQLEFLLERGCHVAQGYLFGRPMVPAEIVPLLEELSDHMSETLIEEMQAVALDPA